MTAALADPPRDTARFFRAAMQAMARPGRIYQVDAPVPPAPLSPAAAALILTLCDRTTPVHLAGTLDDAAVRDWLTFQTGAPLTRAEDATFAIGGWTALQPLDRFGIGTPDYPDRSATLIVEMADLTPKGTRLTGPGIEVEHHLNLPNPAAFQGNAARFPLGLDFFLTSGSRLAAVPRSTRIG